MTKKHRLKCKFYKFKKRKKRRGRKKVIYKIKCVIKRLNIICPKHPSIGVEPKVRRYFFVAPDDIHLSGESIVLYPDQFVDDKGETVAKFVDFGQEGYFNLYVNGALQEGKLYQANSDALTILPTGQTIYKGTPIILESVGFKIASK